MTQMVQLFGQVLADGVEKLLVPDLPFQKNVTHADITVKNTCFLQIYNSCKTCQRAMIARSDTSIRLTSDHVRERGD
jgi:hypothetical protein